MRPPRTDLTKVHLQDQILAKFGPEKIDEAKKRLCERCIFHILHGRKCSLLPLILTGADCPYFGTTEIPDPGGDQNG